MIKIMSFIRNLNSRYDDVSLIYTGPLWQHRAVVNER